MLVAGAIFCGLVWLGAHGNWAVPPDLPKDGSIAAIGRALLTTYSLAFELISLALLVAILGALAIARTGRTPPGSESRLQAAGYPSAQDGSASCLRPPKAESLAEAAHCN